MIKTKDGFLIEQVTAKIGDIIAGKPIAKILGRKQFPVAKGGKLVMMQMLEIAFEEIVVPPVVNNITDEIVGNDNLGDHAPQELADWQNFFQDN